MDELNKFNDSHILITIFNGLLFKRFLEEIKKVICFKTDVIYFIIYKKGQAYLWYINLEIK